MNKNQKVLIVILVILVVIGGISYFFFTKNKAAEPSTNQQQTQNNPNNPSTSSQNIKIEAYDPMMGINTAPITVVEAADFQCPYCGAASGKNPTIVTMMQQNDASWQPVIPNLIKDYVNTGKVKLIFKQFPFLGVESESAAEASLCASDQGKFWDFYDYLYGHQGGENSGTFSNDNLEKFASALGLNTSTFNQCLSSGQHKNDVVQDQSDDVAAGINSAPSFFVGSQKIVGAVPYSSIKSVIDSQLQGK